MTIDTALAVLPAQDNAKLTKRRHGAAEDAGRPVPHWGMDQVMGLVVSARTNGRGAKGDRDALLIQTLFDGALRISEPDTSLRIADNCRHHDPLGALYQHDSGRWFD